jgi:FkbM family methyltransferase
MSELKDDHMIRSLLGEFRRMNPDFEIGVIDVGAREGIHERWKSIESYAQFIGFEPDSEEYGRLVVQGEKDTNVKYLNTALHSRKGTLDFHLLKARQTSSVLLPNLETLGRFPEVERFEIEKTVALKVDTLDNALRGNKIENVDFMKLDTQGSELSILEGATRVLQGVFGLEIEVEFVELYQDQALFGEVDRFVRKRGFELFDLRPNYWKRKVCPDLGGIKGQLVFADALYLRTVDSVISFADSNMQTKILKSIALSVVFGYFDYAFEIAERSRRKGLLSGRILELLTAYAEQNTSRTLQFRGKGRLVNLLYRLLRVLDPCCRLGLRQVGGWSACGNYLANIE